MNDVRGGAEASIVGSTVEEGTGDVTVVALESATIDAKADSSVSASGGSSIDWDGDGKTDGKDGKPTDTDPGTDKKPGSAADPAPPAGGETPAPPADPADETKKAETPKDKVLSMNGVIATNIVQSSAKATISGSTIHSTDDVTVAAENVSAIKADTKSTAYVTGGDTYGVTMAFNTIGWKATNFLFNGVDALLGDDLIADAFGGKNASKTEATIVNSAIDADGALSVTADNKASIDATVSNDSTSKVTSIAGSNGKAAGFIIASNKVASEANALIDNALDTGDLLDIDAAGVTVAASDAASIVSKSDLKALAEIKNDYGASIVNNLAHSAIDSYKFTTKSGVQEVKNGELVYIDADVGDANAGEYWIYTGDTAQIDFATEDFSDRLGQIHCRRHPRLGER